MDTLHEVRPGRAVPVKMVYMAPPPGRAPARDLVVVAGPDAGRRFTFYDYIELGRLEPGQTAVPGTLRIGDDAVSSRHCVITQDPGGRCYLRDMSKNGTRVDHHRVVPGAETEIRPGQVLSLGADVSLRVDGAEEVTSDGAEPGERGTKLLPSWLTATVVVGDICNYTTLVRKAPQETLQASVSSLFHELTRLVTEQDGTVKEYAGDAILAYWEAGESENCAVRACRSALALQEAAHRLARDRSTWRLEDWPLEMDWALASGQVLVNSMGGAHPVGLSMIGPPVVLAYRIEKLASEDTGRILACAQTRKLAEGSFRFGELGPKQLEGFTAPQELFVLTGDA